MIGVEELTKLYWKEYKVVHEDGLSYLRAMREDGRLDCIKFMRPSKYAVNPELKNILRKFEELGDYLDTLLCDRRRKCCIFKYADWIMTDEPVDVQFAKLARVQDYFEKYHSMDSYNEWEELHDEGRYIEGFMDMWHTIEPHGNETEIWATMLRANSPDDGQMNWNIFEE